MFSVYGKDKRTEFIVPFGIALASGLPVLIFWVVGALHFRMLASTTSILLGLACGFAARKAAGGGHPLEAALISTLIHLVAGISIITLHEIAVQDGVSMLSAIIRIVREGGYSEFANTCVWIAGRTFYSYIIALFVAGWISRDA